MLLEKKLRHSDGQRGRQDEPQKWRSIAIPVQICGFAPNTRQPFRQGLAVNFQWERIRDLRSGVRSGMMCCGVIRGINGSAELVSGGTYASRLLEREGRGAGMHVRFLTMVTVVAGLAAPARAGDPTPAAILRPPDNNHALAVAISPDGRLVAVGTRGTVGVPDRAGTLTLWDPAGKRVATLAWNAGNVALLAFSPDGTRLAAGGSEGTVRVWDVGKWPEVAAFDHGGHRVTGLVFTPDGGSLVTATAHPEGLVRRWDLKAKTATNLFRVADAAPLKANDYQTVDALALSPDGKTLALGVTPGLLLVDVAGRKVVDYFRGNGTPVGPVVFSRTGKYLAAAGGGHGVRVYAASGWKAVADLKEGLCQQPAALVFTPDEQVLVGGYSVVDGEPAEVVAWDISRARPMAVFRCHRDGLFAVELSADGTTLATASADGTAALWDWPAVLKAGARK
jgi:WD40 repeat protein